MSYQHVLTALAGDAPVLNTQNAILSAPVRHIFMISTVWYLAQQRNKAPLSIMEVGSWFGASALSWAQGLKEHNDAEGTLTCVDAWAPFLNLAVNNDAWYVEMEKVLSQDVAYNIFQHNMRTLPKTITRQHLRGQSSNILPMLKPETFDIVFIDADHAYTPVKQDLLSAMPLVKDGGILCGDDLNLQLHECDAKAAEENKEKDLIKDSKTGRNIHPGVTIAVHELLGEVAMWGGYWAMQKKGNKWEKISLKDAPIIYPAHFPKEALERAKSHLADIDIR